jgi:hypothetical protein
VTRSRERVFYASAEDVTGARTRPKQRLENATPKTA